MQGLVEVAHMQVVAVDGHEVMDKVIGADAEKVAFAGQGIGDEHGRRGLHHDAQGQIGGVGQTGGLQLLLQFLHDAAHALHLGQAGDHGQQQGDIAFHPGAHEGAQLAAEDLLVPQAEADAAQAQGRVGFLEGFLGAEHLVRTGVQGTEDHMRGRGLAGHGAVFGVELFLAGQMLPQEGEFRTVQAHAFGAAGLQFVHLFQALQVGMDAHAHAVAHLGGPVGLAAGAGLPLLILALALFIGGQVVGIGVQQQAAVEAVHDDLFTGLAGLQQAGDAHQGRDVQAARQNGRVRRGPALCRDDGPHVLEIHVHDVGGRKILGGQDTGTGRGGQGAAAGQAFAQAQAHGPDILRTVAQIGVVHVAEDAAQLFHRAVQGPGGADQFLLDAGKGAAHQLGIAGQFDLGGDDFTVFGKVFRDLGHGFLQGGAHIGHGGAQLFLLAFHFARADAAHLHGLDIVGEAQHPDGDAGRDGRTEKKRACHISPADFPDNRPGPSGLRGRHRPGPAGSACSLWRWRGRGYPACFWHRRYRCRSGSGCRRKNSGPPAPDGQQAVRAARHAYAA